MSIVHICQCGAPKTPHDKVVVQNGTVHCNIFCFDKHQEELHVGTRSKALRALHNGESAFGDGVVSLRRFHGGVSDEALP